MPCYTPDFDDQYVEVVDKQWLTAYHRFPVGYKWLYQFPFSYPWWNHGEDVFFIKGCGLGSTTMVWKLKTDFSNDIDYSASGIGESSLVHNVHLDHLGDLCHAGVT
ncbi:hypothetical protein ACFE04_030385 [Oxalis oulophora]